MKVFISYSHDSPDQMNRVLGLCDRLRADGIDCTVDQYEMSPSAGWPRWTNNQIEEADFILVVCTEIYRRRFKGQEETGKGLGVKWEGAIITQELYDAEANNNKFIPILFDLQDRASIPTILRGHTYYEVNTQEGYESLYRRLINQPLVSKPPLGTLRPMPPLERKQVFTVFKEDTDKDSAAGTLGTEERLPERKKASIVVSVILILLPSVIVTVIVLIILNWHRPTLVRLNITVRKVTFTVGGNNKSTIVDSIGLESIGIEKFEEIRLRSESLNVISPSRQQRLVPRLQNTAREILTVNSQPIMFKAKDERYQSNVLFSEAERGQRSPLLIESVMVNPSAQITLEGSEDANELIVRIDGQRSSGNFTAAGLLKFSVDQCEISGIKDYPFEDQPVTFTASLLKGSSIEFKGQPNTLVLTFTVPEEKAASLFPKENIPITTIRFDQQEPTGAVITSLVKDGELTYPGFETKIDKVTIKSTDFIAIDDLNKFSIEAITLDPSQKGISLILQGVANKIIIGSTNFKSDRRLTAYDVIWNNHQIAALFGILCWGIGTTIAAYKLYRERNK